MPAVQMLDRYRSVVLLTSWRKWSTIQAARTASKGGADTPVRRAWNVYYKGWELVLPLVLGCRELRPDLHAWPTTGWCAEANGLNVGVQDAGLAGDKHATPAALCCWMAGLLFQLVRANRPRCWPRMEAPVLSLSGDA